MASVEDFWAVMNRVVPASKLPNSCNYHLFREGIEPKWEDPANEGGGKWVYSQTKQRREKLDKAWMRTCVAAIGEQLENEHFSDQVCGVVVSVRKNQDRLAVWIRSGTANESAVMAVGNRWKDLLELRGQTKIGFQVHAESLKSGGGGSAGGSLISGSNVGGGSSSGLGGNNAGSGSGSGNVGGAGGGGGGGGGGGINSSGSGGGGGGGSGSGGSMSSSGASGGHSSSFARARFVV